MAVIDEGAESAAGEMFSRNSGTRRFFRGASMQALSSRAPIDQVYLTRFSAESETRRFLGVEWRVIVALPGGR